MYEGQCVRFISFRPTDSHDYLIGRNNRSRYVEVATLIKCGGRKKECGGEFVSTSDLDGRGCNRERNYHAYRSQLSLQCKILPVFLENTQATHTATTPGNASAFFRYRAYHASDNVSSCFIAR